MDVFVFVFEFLRFFPYFCTYLYLRHSSWWPTTVSQRMPLLFTLECRAGMTTAARGFSQCITGQFSLTLILSIWSAGQLPVQLLGSDQQRKMQLLVGRCDLLSSCHWENIAESCFYVRYILHAPLYIKLIKNWSNLVRLVSFQIHIFSAKKI